jgi:hypothetical protein
MFGLEKPISCFHFHFCFSINLHAIALQAISTFPLFSHCIRMFVYSLHSACLFPHTPPHFVRISLYYSLAITGAICFTAGFLCDERRFPYPPFSPFHFLFLGARVFFVGVGGWFGGGIDWAGYVEVSSLRKEFVLGERCHAWAIGLDHFWNIFLCTFSLYFFSSMILAWSTV